MIERIVFNRVRVADDDPDRDDPVLAMLGVGRDLWINESGDQLVERLRSEDSEPLPLRSPPPPKARQTAFMEAVWQRIGRHQGEEFRTARQLPVTFRIEGNGIWFFRDGKRIERKATRAQVEEAISRCPLRSTSEIKDLIDYPYLFAVLSDRRIREKSW